MLDSDNFGRLPYHFTVFVFLGIIIFSAFFYVYFESHVLLNTYLGPVNLSTLDKNDASAMVSRYIDTRINEELQFNLENKAINVNLSDLGVSLDKEATLERVLAQGFSDNYLGRIKNRFMSMGRRTDISPQYVIDFAKLEEFKEKLSEHEVKSLSSTIEFKAGTPFITKSVDGKVINWTKFSHDLRQRLAYSGEQINVELIEQKPIVSTENASDALVKVKAIDNKSITLSYGRDRWVLSDKELLSLLKFYPSTDEDVYLLKSAYRDSFIVKWVASNPKSKQLVVNVDEVKLDQYLASISSTIDRKTIDANLRFEGGRVIKFTPAVDGQKLDIIRTRALILDEIDKQDATTKAAVISLPVLVTTAKIANEEINNLGIKELIGRGISYFAGSIPNRVHNIGLGASFVSGTVVAPGETFSFTSLVGPVSASQGFKEAYVIKSGRTVLDDGGGICQVSTTVYRAALNSGLPIIARTAHAYRVSYYEQRGFKPGLDATIFSPTVDLKFKNDTSRHILVQAVLDRTNSMLQVDIYGTKDGRQVELIEPVILSQSPAPPPLYQDDPNLPRGTTKQVDFAAGGAVTVFTRKVTRGGETLIDESVKSNFRPWQAVYLVGTGG